jgi:NADH-quinone oxidoreductase subunit L
MLGPVIVLAILAAIGGFVEIPGLWRLFSGYLAGTFTHYAVPAAAQLPAESAVQFWLLAIVAVAVALTGIGLAWNWYGGSIQREAPARLAAQLSGLYRLLVGKYFIDELYDTIFVKPALAISRFLAQVFDRELLDGVVRGVAVALGGIGQGLRTIQTGYVRQYLLSMLVGAVVIIAFLLIR